MPPSIRFAIEDDTKGNEVAAFRFYHFSTTSAFHLNVRKTLRRDDRLSFKIENFIKSFGEKSNSDHLVINMHFSDVLLVKESEIFYIIHNSEPYVSSNCVINIDSKTLPEIIETITDFLYYVRYLEEL